MGIEDLYFKITLLGRKLRGQIYGNLKEEVSLEGMKPVLSETEFAGVLKKIK
jgi:hypothetical protein